jgi:hypothetical protein
MGLRSIQYSYCESIYPIIEKRMFYSGNLTMVAGNVNHMDVQLIYLVYFPVQAENIPDARTVLVI